MLIYEKRLAATLWGAAQFAFERDADAIEWPDVEAPIDERLVRGGLLNRKSSGPIAGTGKSASVELGNEASGENLTQVSGVKR